MGRLIRRVGFCITLLCLLWTGSMIADLTQLQENMDDEKILCLKEEICDVIGEYAEKVKNVVTDTLIVLDRVIDHVLEAAGNDGELENIFSAGGI